MYTVLIADDDILMIDQLSLLIGKSEDFCVVGAVRDGAAAIREIEEKPPDVVITDMEMPIASGVEVARYVQEHCPATVVLALSNYDTFDFVRPILRLGAFDYILKHNLSENLLRKKLEEVKEEISRRSSHSSRMVFYSLLAKQNCFRSLLLEEPLSSEQKKILASEPEFCCMRHGVICFQITNFIKVRNGQLESREKTIHSILNLCSSIFSTKKNGVVTHMENGLFAVILGEGKNTSAAAMREFVNTMIFLLRGNLSRIIQINAIFASECFSGAVEQVPDVYRRVCRNLEHMCFSSGVSVREKPASDGVSSIDILDEKELVNAIYRADKGEMRTVVVSIFDKTRDGGLCDIQAAVYSLQGLLSRFSRLCGTPPDFPDFTETVSVNALDKIKEYFSQVFDTLIDCLPHGESNRIHSAYIREAVSYIHTHYAEDLSLSSMAKTVHLSDVYFSKLFKIETGKSFVDYLTNYRISIAVDLLKNSDVPVKELFEKVGFKDYNYFIRVFHSIVGVPPMSYKKRAKEAQAQAKKKE